MEIRNITIIAHVDHGKTTLVDEMLKLTESLDARDSRERVMDSMDLERERGITIRAKNASIEYKSTKINIIDTPGHADFGGEVERVLSMADTSLILVDAQEGPMPQTRFVLEKSLKLGHRPIVVINKIDREFADPDRVLNEIFDLFDELGADSEQLDFPTVYCSAKLGYASLDADRAGKEDTDLRPLMDLVLQHTPPTPDTSNEPLQFQIMNLDYDAYVGHLGIGRIFRGKINKNESVSLIKSDGSYDTRKVSLLYGYRAMQRVELEEAVCGDIIAVGGMGELVIGQTICAPGHEEARPPIIVDEPTVSMQFMVNDSPMAGKEGRFVTTRQIADRLRKETMVNVALRVTEDPENRDRFIVDGRGDLHLAVLAESMRREGFEFQVSRPQVIFRTENGRKTEPYEVVIIDLPEEYSGSVISELNQRKGEMVSMRAEGHGTVRIEYTVPTRGLISFRPFLITETRGTAALNSRFLKYDDYAGPIPGRKNGALVSMEAGQTVAFALYNLQDRGTLFLGPGIQVYGGMVIGECNRDSDMDINPCKEKKQSNVRSSGADEAIRLIPPREMGLDQALEFISDDELTEITPKSIRIRKRYLDPHERKRHAKKLTESRT